MKLAKRLMEERALSAMVAKVDDLPTRKWKSPLQQAVQIIKRHCDVMFIDDPDGMPISIILTTLTARAYGGETDVATALDRILKHMASCVRTTIPRVPNPVNPAEDFADKWRDPKYRHLNLEQNFWTWLAQAQEDFHAIAQARDSNHLADLVNAKFATFIDKKRIEEKLGWASSSVVTRPKVHIIEQTPAKPWMHV
jgi:hypothetical protein